MQSPIDVRWHGAEPAPCRQRSARRVRFVSEVHTAISLNCSKAWKAWPPPSAMRAQVHSPTATRTMIDALAGPTIHLPKQARARITRKPTLRMVMSTLPQYCGNSLLWRLTWRSITKPEPSMLYWLNSATAAVAPTRIPYWLAPSKRASKMK